MIVGLALAGGESRRMGGGDKPLVEIGGRPMLAHVLDRLRTETVRVAISANGDPARFAAFGCPVLPDGEFAGRGPLAGVLAGLDWAAQNGAGALLTIPGDTPFVPAGIAAGLAPAPAHAASGGRSHYLVALWPIGVGTSLRERLAAGPCSVLDFAGQIGARAVEFPIKGYDPFLNVNTREDLRRLEREGAADAPWSAL